MKPEATALTILSTARAQAKMHEFRVAPEDFNALPCDPSLRFSLAIGILGDVAAAVAGTLDVAGVHRPHFLDRPAGTSWTRSRKMCYAFRQFSSMHI